MAFQNRLSWYLSSNAYWWATSYKWFLMLLLGPTKIAAMVPGGEKNQTWGLVVIIGGLAAMVGPAIFGSLSDRFFLKNRAVWTVLGAFLTCGSLLLFINASTVPMLIGAFLCLQVADDIGTGPYSAVIAESVPEEHRGRASGIRGLLTQGANVIGGIAAVAAGGNVDLLVYSIVASNLIMAWITLRSLRGVARLPALRPQAPDEPWWHVFRMHDFRVLWISQFLIQLGFYLVQTYGVNFLNDMVAVPAADTTAEFGKIAIVLSLVASLSAAYWGGKADQYGRKRIIIGAGLWMMLAIMPLPWLRSIDSILVLAFLFGLGFGPAMTLVWAVGSDAIGAAPDAARTMGLWQSAVVVPQLVAGMFGWVADSMNRQVSGGGYAVLFGFSALAFFFGSILVRRVRASY
jgi:MFS family permease